MLFRSQVKAPIPKSELRESKLIDGVVWDGKDPAKYADEKFGIPTITDILKELEKDTPPGRRDPTNYFVTIFGEPSADKSWG